MRLTIVDKQKKETFISIFQVLKGCASTINISFNAEDVYIQGMDKSHVCLFDIKILKEWFHVYETDDTDKSVVGIDTSIFYNILSMNKDNCSLTIHYENDPDCINIDLINETNAAGEYSKYFKLPLVDLDCDLLHIPDTDYAAEFSVNAKKIHEITSQLQIFGDVMNIQCNEEKINIISKGVDGEMMVNIPIDDLEEFAISEGEELNISYSLNYIHKMCITTKLSSEIKFHISGDCPMKISYDLGYNSHVMFYIAPKIEDD
jgi:proliferating cell nuclear antigen PCNA